MKKSNKFYMILIIIGIFCFLSPALVYAQSKAGGKVLLYTSVPLELATQYTNAFMKKYPEIKVEVYRAGSTEVEAKLAAEQEVGGIRADLLWLADAPVYYKLRDKGLLLSYKPKDTNMIPTDLKDPNGYFIAGRLINMIIGVNTSVIPLASAPKSWRDFPNMGKQATMGSPLYSGSNFVTAATFVKRDGNWSWFEKCRQKGVVVVRGNSEAARALAGKEFAIAMTLDYMIYELANKGAPLAIIWPEEGAISVASPLAIFKASKNPDSAKAFIDYVISKEGQEFLVKQGVIPVRKDVPSPKGQPPLDKIKFLPIPYEWAAQNSVEIREKFEKIMLH